MNLEQQEALQAELTKENYEFYATLSDEDKAKHDAVHDAMVILTNAGVGVTAFCWVKNPAHPDGESPVQYNNWGEVLGLYAGDMVMTEEQKDKSSEINAEFAAAMYNYISMHCDGSEMGDLSSPEKVVAYFNHFSKRQED